MMIIIIIIIVITILIIIIITILIMIIVIIKTMVIMKIMILLIKIVKIIIIIDDKRSMDIHLHIDILMRITWPAVNLPNDPVLMRDPRDSKISGKQAWMCALR